MKYLRKLQYLKSQLWPFKWKLWRNLFPKVLLVYFGTLTILKEVKTTELFGACTLYSFFRCWSNRQVWFPLLSSTNGSWTGCAHGLENCLWIPSSSPQERQGGPGQHSTCCVSELMLWVRHWSGEPVSAVPWWRQSSSSKCDVDRCAWFPYGSELQSIKKVLGKHARIYW